MAMQWGVWQEVVRVGVIKSPVMALLIYQLREVNVEGKLIHHLIKLA